MSSCTDPLCLNEKKLFKVLRESLPKDLKDTRNIIEIRDDVLYAWNADKGAILTLNVAATRGKASEDVSYQTLLLTDPPMFEITNLLINETLTQLVMWGNLGLALVELPSRWGKDGAFEGGKDVVTCISHNLNSCWSYFASGEVRRARWHPGSTNDSHLVVLTSQNTLQLFESEVGSEPKLIRNWNIGMSRSGSPSKIPSFEDLGDTAVDFDFTTPTVKKSNGKMDKINWNQIEWSILGLCGSGEVFIIRENILGETYSKSIRMEFLTIHPWAEDNYGTEFCSIMCIQTTPPIVILASCHGKIYHGILLKDVVDEKDKLNSSNSIIERSNTPKDALYIYEIIEMELGLLYREEDKKYTCPINLHSDKGNKSRYFCSHNAGIHMVSLPMVSQLDEYINASEENSELYIPTLSNQSSFQYLLCTRTKHTNENQATPILGFGLLQDPCVLIVLLHTGVVVDLTVVDLQYLPKLEQPEPTMSPSKKVTKVPFDVYIKGLLRHEVTQPITKLSNQSELSAREALELLYRATHIFRTSYFINHDKVREELSKKVRSLKALKEHQLKELDRLIETKRELKQTAEHLAEHYEDIKDVQEDLARRADTVLRLVKQKEPSMSVAERAEALALKDMADNINELKMRLEQLKKKASDQAKYRESYKKSNITRDIVLSKSQEEAIKTNLKQIGNDIAGLISQVKNLQIDIGL
ncbi:nuclear pore complex protein Nup88 [Cephus cinctus]|uniref:Nuclear pore complex protein Nup88 n=1 Tax=Cephus cinctus TaxID=211228 RepID=A0AAJ7W3N4_CEPCN|nr:nuclear pore complex protein Nup88 [Cephus cinctus]